MKTTTKTTGPVWLLERNRPHRGWVSIGRVRAADITAAKKRAQEITGDSLDNLRAVGIAADGKEQLPQK